MLWGSYAQKKGERIDRVCLHMILYGVCVCVCVSCVSCVCLIWKKEERNVSLSLSLTHNTRTHTQYTHALSDCGSRGCVVFVFFLFVCLVFLFLLLFFCSCSFFFPHGLQVPSSFLNWKQNRKRHSSITLPESKFSHFALFSISGYFIYFYSFPHTPAEKAPCAARRPSLATRCAPRLLW